MRLFGRTRDALDLAASFPPAGMPPAPTGPAIASPFADSTALDTVTWAGLLDVADQLPVTRSQAIALPAVARGRDLIAITVGRFPLWALNAGGRLPVQPRLIAQPEVGRPRFVTMLWTVDDLIFHGVAWWIVVERYADSGRPRSVRWCPHTAAEVDSYGNLTRAWGVSVNPFDVIRFDGPSEGFLNRGNGTVRSARRLAARYADAINTPTPDVELHQVSGDALTPAQVTELIGTWAAARRGENGRVAYTNQGIEAKMHGEQPHQLLIAARDAIALDCSRHLNLPAWAVDVSLSGSSLTYSNVPSRSRELIDFAFAGYLEAIAGRLSLDDVLAAGTWAAHQTDVLTEGDFASRMTAYKTATEAQVYTADELRAREAGVPVEGNTA